MVETEDLSSADPSEIRQSIKETRASLSSKLEALEHEVKETAQEAKSSVEQQVEEVKQAFNLKHQVRRRPWQFMGGALVLGFVVGRALTPQREDVPEQRWQPLWKRGADPAAANLHANGGGMLRHSTASSRGSQLHDTVQVIRGAALGVLLNVLREAAKEAVPSSFVPKVHEMFDGVGKSLGAKTSTDEPLRGQDLH